jgi:hypothetical protein
MCTRQDIFEDSSPMMKPRVKLPLSSPPCTPKLEPPSGRLPAAWRAALREAGVAVPKTRGLLTIAECDILVSKLPSSDHAECRRRAILAPNKQRMKPSVT